MELSRKAGICLLVVLSVVLLCACGSRNGPGDTAGKKVVFSAHSDATGFTGKLYNGIEAKAKDIGVEVSFLNAKGDANLQIDQLKQAIAATPGLLPQIEARVHPLVAQDRAAFLTQARSDIVVLDIPLLFEKGTEVEMDATLLVTAQARLQRQRVLARPGMTDETLRLILSRQMPDAEKRARATHIVETLALDQTHSYIRALIAYIRSQNA